MSFLLAAQGGFVSAPLLKVKAWGGKQRVGRAVGPPVWELLQGAQVVLRHRLLLLIRAMQVVKGTVGTKRDSGRDGEPMEKT